MSAAATPGARMAGGASGGAGAGADLDAAAGVAAASGAGAGAPASVGAVPGTHAAIPPPAPPFPPAPQAPHPGPALPPGPQPSHDPFPPGSVCLVGAGPGAPDLLTLRGWQRLQAADVVVHDRLIDPALLAAIPPRAQRLYVGKSAGNHAVPQARIEQLLIEHARAGQRVVRLKGGDPFIFGRGGEELQALRHAGVPCEVVPGISAAQGCAAAAQIPLTHRGLARQCLLLPGHLSREEDDLDWPTLARMDSTLAFYMGTQRLPHIASQLVAHGMAADTPAALIIHGTRADQRIDVQPLHHWQHHPANCPDAQAGLLLVGKAVALAQALHNRPATMDLHSKPPK